MGPLHGRGTSPPEWNGQGARLLVFTVPAHPERDALPVEVADDRLHILHNFTAAHFTHTERDELLTASRDGLHLMARGDDGRWTKCLRGAFLGPAWMDHRLKLTNDGQREVASIGLQWPPQEKRASREC